VAWTDSRSSSSRSPSRLDGIHGGSRADFDVLNAFLTQHGIHPIIDRAFAFDDARAAFTHMKGAGHFGKIVIKIS
jgi:NADPH:quinone reductase-like Zn-dependent oxidoreductase